MRQNVNMATNAIMPFYRFTCLPPRECSDVVVSVSALQLYADLERLFIALILFVNCT